MTLEVPSPVFLAPGFQSDKAHTFVVDVYAYEVTDCWKPKNQVAFFQ
jgi:hypothetical protein